MYKKYWIIWFVLLILFIVAVSIGIITSKDKQETEKETENKMIVRTMQFLQTKVNYPDTFDYVGYPEVEWHKEEVEFAIISGQFKCANAFGVYNTHNFAVAMRKKDFYIISYKVA